MFLLVSSFVGLSEKPSRKCSLAILDTYQDGFSLSVTLLKFCMVVSLSLTASRGKAHMNYLWITKYR